VFDMFWRSGSVIHKAAFQGHFLSVNQLVVLEYK